MTEDKMGGLDCVGESPLRGLFRDYFAGAHRTKICRTRNSLHSKETLEKEEKGCGYSGLGDGHCHLRMYCHLKKKLIYFQYKNIAL